MAEEQTEYKPFMLVDPRCPELWNVGNAKTEWGMMVLVIIETPTGSERHFITTEMATDIRNEMTYAIEEAKKANKALVVVESKLITPGGLNGS